MWNEAADPLQVRAVGEAIAALLPMPVGPRRPLRIAFDAADAPPTTIAAAAAPLVGAWLDGGDGGRHQIPLRVRAMLSGIDRQASLRVGTETAQLHADPLVALEGLLQNLQRAGAVRVPRLFGFLGYDLGALIEEMPEPPAPDMPLPDMWLALCDVWLEGSPAAPGRLTEWHLCTDAVWCGEAELRALRAELRTRVRSEQRKATADEVSVMPAGASVAPVSVPDRDGYLKAVSRTVARIHAGDLFEANICRRLEAEWSASPWTLYRQLRGRSPAEYGAYLAADDWAVLSVSPELFLRVRGGVVQTRPIKGTRPRGRDGDEDARLLQQLCDSDKDAAELSMIVDLARNDLGRVCVPGSVQVLQHREIMSLPTVHHTYSVVEGELVQASIPLLLRAAFPPGSITGAPKIQAMLVAYAEEPRRRGAAMGSIGWLDASGDMELSVAIRTATVGAGRATYHAGCGIVADSVPDEEMEETVAKARPFLLALGDG